MKNIELIKLFNYLNEHGYCADIVSKHYCPCVPSTHEQIIVYHYETAERLWDVAVNPLTMGWNGDLKTSKLEMMGVDKDVIGYLTADDIITVLQTLENFGVRCDF